MFSTLKKKLGMKTLESEGLHKATHFAPNHFSLLPQEDQEVNSEIVSIFNHIHCFPSGVTCAAHDPVQKLLAVGNKRGCIKVFGTTGVELSLLNKAGQYGVRFLSFVVNKGKLISILESNNDLISLINVWELNTNKLLAEVELTFRVTSIHLETGNQLMYLGTTNSNVQAFNIESFRLYSAYTIDLFKDVAEQYKQLKEATDETLEEKFSATAFVVGIQQSPHNEEQMLVGWDCGIVVLWSIPSKRVLKLFSYQKDAELTSLSWELDGDDFLCGYDNGDLCIWSSKQSKASKHTFTITNAEGERKPIKKATWLKMKGDNAIACIGGERENEPCGFVLLQGKQYSKCTLLASNIGNPIADFLILSESPSKIEFSTVLCITENGNLLAAEIVKAEAFQPLPLPQYLSNFQASPITKLQFFEDCPEGLLSNLRQLGAGRDPISSKWPITGGTHQTIESNSLLITCHVGGWLHFWACYGYSLELLYSYRLPRNGNVTHLEFSLPSMELAIAISTGEVLLYNFSMEKLQYERLWYQKVPADQPVVEESGDIGFQLRGIFSFSSVQCIAISDNRMAVADIDGLLVVFNTVAESSQTSVLLTHKFTSPVSCMLFGRRPPHLSSPRKTLEETASQPILFIGLVQGNIHVADVATWQLSLAVETKKVPLQSMYYLSRRGKPLDGTVEPAKDVEGQEENTFLLVCSPTETTIYAVSESVPYSKLSRINPKNPAFFYSIVGNDEDEYCLVTFDSSGSCVIYTLGDLNQIARGQSPIDSSTARSCSLRGNMIFVRSNGELVQTSLFSHVTKEILARHPEPFVENVHSPERQAKSKKSLFSSKSFVAVDHLEAEETKQLQKEQSKSAEVKQQAEDVNETLQHTKQALEMRGQQIEQLSDKSAELANASKDFLDKVRELNRKQAAKKWYEL